MSYKITTFKLGHLGGDRSAEVCVYDEVMGVGTFFTRFPRGWSVDRERFEDPPRSAVDVVNELVRRHGVLGAPVAQAFMGMPPPPVVVGDEPDG